MAASRENNSTLESFLTEVFDSALPEKIKTDTYNVINCLIYIEQHSDLIQKANQVWHNWKKVYQDRKWTNDDLRKDIFIKTRFRFRDFTPNHAVLRDDNGTGFHIDFPNEQTAVLALLGQVEAVKIALQKLNSKQRLRFAEKLQWDPQMRCLDARTVHAIKWAENRTSANPDIHFILQECQAAYTQEKAQGSQFLFFKEHCQREGFNVGDHQLKQAMRNILAREEEEEKDEVKEEATEEKEYKENNKENRFTNAQVYRDYKGKMVISFASIREGNEHLSWIKSVFHAWWWNYKFDFLQEIVSKGILRYCFRLTEEQWQQLRIEIRSKIVPQLPKTDFIIKSLRADERNFFSDYIKAVIPPFTKLPLRREPKKKYTVTGRGIAERATKKPQYTLEQKQGFSKPKSSSLGTPSYFPRVFGFNTIRQDILVGAFLDSKDILLSDRNYIYDGGTVVRPYDFHHLEHAQQYAEEKIDKILFSADKIADFKKAISDPKNKDNYNETLTRQRWNTDGSSQIFIGSDTLASRLQAQEYARLIKCRLSEVKAVPNDYSVRIFYYLPNNDELNFKEYTTTEQEMDRLEAVFSYEKIAERLSYYQNHRYQLLLALPREIIKTALQEEMPATLVRGTLLWRILKAGYIHILVSLADKLGEPISSILDGANNVSDNKPHACYYLMRAGYFAEARELIKKHNQGVNFNQTVKDDQTPLFLAADEGNGELVNELLLQGVECNHRNNNGKTPLWVAAYCGHLAIVQALLANDANSDVANMHGATPLYVAAQNSHLAVVKALLAVGADLNKEHNDGSTPLYKAVQNGHLAVVEALLEKGADLHKADIVGATPLLIAVQKKSLPITEHLLNAKANINQQLPYCKSPVLLAIAKSLNKDAALKKLIEGHYQGEIPFKVISNCTALHLAAINGQSEMVALLLKHGADVNLRTTEGISARDIALAMGHHDIARMLIKTEPKLRSQGRRTALATIEQWQQLSEQKESDGIQNEYHCRVMAFNKLDQYVVQLTNSIYLPNIASELTILLAEYINQAYYQCQPQTSSEEIAIILQKLAGKIDFYIKELKKQKLFLGIQGCRDIEPAIIALENAQGSISNEPIKVDHPFPEKNASVTKLRLVSKIKNQIASYKDDLRRCCFFFRKRKQDKQRLLTDVLNHLDNLSGKEIDHLISNKYSTATAGFFSRNTANLVKEVKEYAQSRLNQ